MQFIPTHPTRDEHDERWARWMREECGQKRWLVSWSRTDRGWVARMSCPDWPETIEADGGTRCLAIGRVHREMELNLKGLKATALASP